MNIPYIMDSNYLQYYPGGLIQFSDLSGALSDVSYISMDPACDEITHNSKHFNT